MKQTETPVTRKLGDAVLLVIADGECAVPRFNGFGGVDLWSTSQAGVRGSNGREYLAEGVRLSYADEEISITKFEKNALITTDIKVTGEISAELLAHIVKGLL